MAESYSGAETMRRLFLLMLGRLRTSMPGVVRSYNASEQTCSVQPQFQLAQSLPGKLREMVTLPLLDRVPVAWPGSIGYGLHAPLQDGDTVLIVFCERSIGTWRVSRGKSPVDPGAQDMHAASGAIVIPRLRRDTETWPGDFAQSSAMTVGSSTSAPERIRIGDGRIEISGGADFVALASAVKAELENLNAYITSHTHPSPNGATSPPTQPLSPVGNVAAQHVKAT